MSGSGERGRVRRLWRDPVGRAIFTTGALLMRSGGWLCGAAGAWDSDTDNPPHFGSTGAGES